MAHIFISYSKQNIEFMRYLRTLLEAEGFTIWVDEERLAPSARWWKTIEENITTCGAVIVIMSPEASESDWVEREILLAEKEKRPIFPVLLAGEAWSRLANIQYADMRAGLRAKLTPALLNGLQSHATVRKPAATTPHITFHIEFNDILRVPADAAVFKYAQYFFGADSAAAEALDEKGIPAEDLMSAPGEYRLVETRGGAAAERALFIGMPLLRDITYADIRSFAARALDILSTQAPDTRHIVMTIHGPGFSRDEREALLAQFAGLRDAMQAGTLPRGLERITIVELSKSRMERLRQVMEGVLDGADYAERLVEGWGYRLRLDAAASPEPQAIESAGAADTKPYAFVVLPPNADLDDVFYYGIQTPIHALGLLCERIEPGAALDDWLEQICRRIDSAAVVVAELSAPDPAVYLQLGYARGKGRPLVLLARDGHSPHAALAKEPLLSYRRIKDLETDLLTTLSGLVGS
ncbi:MAG: toll/interleukin-1 receptor domain-containing protein [Anaerolineae bacterium]|nr:toll/interleukin-1 receptor domain-containing protein [Anaerolineae bacterium]